MKIIIKKIVVHNHPKPDRLITLNIDRLIGKMSIDSEPSLKCPGAYGVDPKDLRAAKFRRQLVEELLKAISSVTNHRDGSESENKSSDQ